MDLPYNWRITKYNPALRNSQGSYLAEDWTSISDVGKSYGGEQLTHKEYLSCESAYVGSAMSFLSEAGLSSLRVVELENRRLAHVEVSRLRDIEFQPVLLKPDATISRVNWKMSFA